jgi:hypothetical protein
MSSVGPYVHCYQSTAVDSAGRVCTMAMTNPRREAPRDNIECVLGFWRGFTLDGFNHFQK